MKTKATEALSLFQFGGITVGTAQASGYVYTEKANAKGGLARQSLRIGKDAEIEAVLMKEQPGTEITEAMIMARKAKMGDDIIAQCEKVLREARQSRDWAGTNITASYSKKGVATIHMAVKQKTNRSLLEVAAIAEKLGWTIEQVQETIDRQLAKVNSGNGASINVESTTTTTSAPEAPAETPAPATEEEPTDANTTPDLPTQPVTE